MRSLCKRQSSNCAVSVINRCSAQRSTTLDDEMLSVLNKLSGDRRRAKDSRASHANADKLLADIVMQSNKEQRKLEDQAYWDQVKGDEVQGGIYRQFEDCFANNVVVLGDSRVGKTSLLHRICKDQLARLD